MVALSGNAGLMVAQAATYGALSYAQQRAQNKQVKAIMDEYKQLQAQNPMMLQAAQQQQQQAITFPFPYPIHGVPPLPIPPLAIEDESVGDKSRRLGRQRVVYGLRPKAKAKAPKGRGAPTDEQTAIGSAAPLPYIDITNDSFLIKPKSTAPAT
jgi:hypothetical protein